MNLSKNAIGNLINRYKAVLKKCHLLNTFGSLAVAGMLAAGSVGVGVVGVGLVGDAHAASLNNATVDTDGAGTEWTGGIAPDLTLEIGSITSGDSTVGANADLTIFGDGSTSPGQVSAGNITVDGGTLTIGGSSSPENTTFGGILSTNNDGIINITSTNLTHAKDLNITGGALNVAANASLTSGELTANDTSMMNIQGHYKINGDFDAKANGDMFFVDGSAPLADGQITVGADGVFEIDGTFTGGGGGASYGIKMADGATIKAKNMDLSTDTTLFGGNISITADFNDNINLLHTFKVDGVNSTLSLKTSGTGTVSTGKLNAEKGTINIESGGAVNIAGFNPLVGSDAFGTISIKGTTITSSDTLNARNGAIILAASTADTSRLDKYIEIYTGSVTLKDKTNAILGDNLTIRGIGSFNVQDTAKVDASGKTIDLGADGTLTVASTSDGFDITGADLTSKVENFGVLNQTAWTMTDAGTVGIDLTGDAATTVLLTANLTGGGQLLSTAQLDALSNSAKAAIFGASTHVSNKNIVIAGVSEEHYLDDIDTKAKATAWSSASNVIGAGDYAPDEDNVSSTFAGIVQGNATSADSVMDKADSVLNLTGNNGIALSQGNITVKAGTLNLGYDGSQATQGGTLKGNLTVNDTSAEVNVYGTEYVTIEGAVNVEAGALTVVDNSGTLTVGTSEASQNVTVGKTGSAGAAFNVDNRTTIYGDLSISDKGTVTVSDYLNADNLSLGGTNTSVAAFNNNGSANTEIIGTTTVNAFGELTVTGGQMITQNLSVAAHDSAKVTIANNETLIVTDTVEFKHDSVDIGDGTLHVTSGSEKGAALKLSHDGETTLKGGSFRVDTIDSEHDIILNDAAGNAAGTQLDLNGGRTWASNVNLTVSQGMVDVSANATLDFASNDKILEVASGSTLEFIGGTVILDLANVGSIDATTKDFTALGTALIDNGTVTSSNTSYLNIDATGLSVTQGQYADMHAAATQLFGGNAVNTANIRFTGLSLDGDIDDLDYVFTDLGTDYATKQLKAGTLIHQGNTIISGIIADDGGATDSIVRGKNVKLTLTGMGSGTDFDVLSKGNVSIEQDGELILGYQNADATMKSPEQLYFDGDINVGSNTTDGTLTVEYSNILMGEKPAGGSAASVTHTVHLADLSIVNVNNGGTLQTKLDNDNDATNETVIGSNNNAGADGANAKFNIGTVGTTTSTLKVAHDLTFSRATNFGFGDSNSINMGRHGVLDVAGAVTFSRGGDLTMAEGAMLMAQGFKFKNGETSLLGGDIKVKHNAHTTIEGALTVDNLASTVIIDVNNGDASTANTAKVTTDAPLILYNGTLDVQAGTLDIEGITATGATQEAGYLVFGTGGILKVASGATVDLSGDEFSASIANFGSVLVDEAQHTATLDTLDATDIFIQGTLMGDEDTSVVLYDENATGILLSSDGYTDFIKDISKDLFGADSTVTDIQVVGVSEYRTLTSVSKDTYAGTRNDLYGVVGAGTYSFDGESTFAGIVEDYVTGSVDSIIDGTANTVLNLTGINGGLLSAGSLSVHKGSVNIDVSDSLQESGTVHGNLTVGNGEGIADAKVSAAGTNVTIAGDVHIATDGVLTSGVTTLNVLGENGMHVQGTLNIAGSVVNTPKLTIAAGSDLSDGSRLKMSGTSLTSRISVSSMVKLPSVITNGVASTVIDFYGATPGDNNGTLQAHGFEFTADTTINAGKLSTTGDMSTHKKLTLHAIGVSDAGIPLDSEGATFIVNSAVYTAESGADVTVTKGTLNLNSSTSVMDLSKVGFTANTGAVIGTEFGSNLKVGLATIGMDANVSGAVNGPASGATVVAEKNGDDGVDVKELKGTVTVTGFDDTIDMSTYSTTVPQKYAWLNAAGQAAFGDETRIIYDGITLTGTEKITLEQVAAGNLSGLGNSAVNGEGKVTIHKGQIVHVGAILNDGSDDTITNNGVVHISGIVDNGTGPVAVGTVYTGDINSTGILQLGNTMFSTQSVVNGNLTGTDAGFTRPILKMDNVKVTGFVDYSANTTADMWLNNVEVAQDVTTGTSAVYLGGENIFHADFIVKSSNVIISTGTTTVAGETKVEATADLGVNGAVLKTTSFTAEASGSGGEPTLNFGNAGFVGWTGGLETDKANFKGRNVLFDPAWNSGVALDYIENASYGAIKAFEDPTTGSTHINGRLIAGQNAFLTLGANNTAFARQVFADADSGLVWGDVAASGEISAALFLQNAQTLDATTGALRVDGRVVEDTKAGGAPVYAGTTTPATPAFDTADFADNSLLVIDAGETGVRRDGNTIALSGGNSLGGSTLTVAATAKLYIVGGKGGELIVADSFENGGIATFAGQTGWSGDNVSFSSNTMQVAAGNTGVYKNAAGQYVLQVDASVANTSYGNMFQSGTAAYLDTQLLNGIGLDVDADAPAGRKFLSIALIEDLGHDMGETNGKRTVATIEGAGQFAALANVAKAVMSSNWAAQGAVQDRNAFGALNSMNSGEGSGSMTLNDGKITAEVGENGGNMADKAGVGVWLTPLYKWNMGSGFESGSLEHDYDMGLGGIALGADFTNRIDAETAFRVGLALNVGAGYSDSTGDFNETNNDFSFWGLNLYGAFQKENFVATLDFGFTSTANELDQDLPASMGMGDLEADVDAFAFSAGLNLEYTFNAGMMDITPHAGVRFMSVTTEKYDMDSSAGRVASVDEDTQNVWYFPIGVTLSADIESESGWKFTPKLDLGILAAAGDLDATSNAQFTGVPGSMELNMDNVDGFAFNGGLGFELSNEDNGISIGLNYNLQAGKNETGHMIFANFRYDF